MSTVVLKAIIDNHLTNVLLDSGAGVSIIESESLKRLNITKHVTPTLDTLIDASGNQMNILGKVTLTILIKGMYCTKSQEFHVIQTNRAANILLGRELMEKFGSMTLDFQHNRVRCCLYGGGLALLRGLALFADISGSGIILHKILFRLHESRASPPRRDLAIAYPSSHLEGLEISHVNAIKRASPLKRAENNRFTHAYELSSSTNIKHGRQGKLYDFCQALFFEERRQVENEAISLEC